MFHALTLPNACICHGHWAHFLSGQQGVLVSNEDTEAKKKEFSSKNLAPRKDSVYEMFRPNSQGGGFSAVKGPFKPSQMLC